ncbi:MAG: hypothetical protein HY270_01660 [Deltaproteobacteria bacterium]|nr:hypothetical protein [Deltaproteobacteria bacterium]
MSFALAVLLLALPASAHVPMVRGQLVAVTHEAELIAVATVTDIKAIKPGTDELTAKIERRLLGHPSGDEVHFRGPHVLAAGERYVLFLRQRAGVWESVAPSGTIFPAKASDDRDYQAAIERLLAAFKQPDNAQAEGTWAALFPALRAANDTLRYNAALDLIAFIDAGHPPSAAQRQQIEQLLATKDLDPALRPILNAVMHRR